MEIIFQVNTQATFEAVKNKRKATEVPDDSQPTKKQMRGRPAKPTRKPPPRRKAPTKLRKDRPVQASLSMDIWEAILSFCTLDRLLKLRGICSTFHSVLASGPVWRKARYNQFGATHPDPPIGLTEMQYADLLVGVGCQAPGCEAKDTRRTYWGFRRRWCEVCLVRYLSKGRQAKQDLLMYDQACKCIPEAKYDSWGHYQWVGHHEQAPAWAALFSSQSVAYSKFDIQDMNHRIQQFMSSSPTEEVADAWFEKQEATNFAYVKQLQKVEQWVEQDRKWRDRDRADMREKRADFFRKCASQMNTPLDADVLSLCPSYDRSIRISKIPSNKSWQKLLPKVEDERAEAEIVLWQKKRKESHSRYRTYLKDNYDDTVERRKSLKSPEQRLVLDLAEQIISDLLADLIGVHASDFVNVILRGVYYAYQAIDDDRKPRNRFGPYRLIMDDARLLYRQKVLPMIERIYDADRKASARLLKCPGQSCRRTIETYEFEDLMQHIHERHRYLNAYQHLLISDHLDGEREVFPWFCTEWPRNMPMLATHQTAPQEWDIDEDAPYCMLSPIKYLSKSSRAFHSTPVAFKSNMGPNFHQ
ncbi:MAG: hypothetical protein Q9217_004102 [Psora testacea]